MRWGQYAQPGEGSPHPGLGVGNHPQLEHVRVPDLDGERRDSPRGRCPTQGLFPRWIVQNDFGGNISGHICNGGVVHICPDVQGVDAAAAGSVQVEEVVKA